MREATSVDVASFYKENGYFVLDEALTQKELEHLRQETLLICRGERGNVRGLEPAAADESNDETLRRYLCIHFPHKISELMMDTLKHPKIVDILTSVIGPDVKCMQSMVFVKAAGKPGQAWHQDEDFIPTRDRSLIGAWIALDDATTENGCLWMIPGSHKPGILWPMQVQEDYRFDCSAESFAFPYQDEDAIPVELKAGSIVFFNGYTLHRSLPNTAKSGYRRALVNHYMSAESMLPWNLPKQGETMATADFRDVVMVAGTDPYAYKGYADINESHIRPSGEGGCGDAENNSTGDIRLSLQEDLASLQMG